VPQTDTHFVERSFRVQGGIDSGTGVDPEHHKFGPSFRLCPIKVPAGP
jgi:hypothetical protein